MGKKIGKICKKNTDSHGDIGPARDICKVLCDTCPTASPIQTPPTGSPTNKVTATPTKSPTDAGVGCCIIDFKNCSPTVVGWCSESKDNCEGPCNKWWLPNGARDGCAARYASCSTDSDCCSPGVCSSGSCKSPVSMDVLPGTHLVLQIQIVVALEFAQVAAANHLYLNKIITIQPVCICVKI